MASYRNVEKTTPINEGYNIINGKIWDEKQEKTVDVWIEWKQTEMDAENNTSKLRVLLYVDVTKASFGLLQSHNGNAYVNMDGRDRQFTEFSRMIPSVYCFIDHTYTVQHERDGGKKVNVVGCWSALTDIAAKGEVRGQIELEKIDRSSSINSALPVEIGKYCQITWKPYCKDFWYKVHLFLPDKAWERTSAPICHGKTSAYTYGVTVPMDLANHITESKTGTIYAELETYFDKACTESVGISESVAVTVTVPENDETRPQITEASIAPTNDRFDGLFIQGYSGVTGNVAASGQYGATIKNVTMIVENKKYSGQLKAYAVNRSGNVKFVVTDSRGFTAQKEIYIKVIPYYVPKVTAKAYRCGADGAANEGGQYLKIEAMVDFASVAGKNKAEIYYQYMEENAANTVKIDVLGSMEVSGDTFVSPPLLEGTLDKGKNFSVRVFVVDCIKSVKTGYMKVPKEAVYLDKPAGGEHIGVGGYCDTEHGPLADVHWNTRVRKGLLLGYGVGSVYISVVADSPAADFGGTWEQITENVPSSIFMWKKTE